MKQRALEILFKKKFLLLLPFLIIMPLAAVVATRPQPRQWQSLTGVWVDQYKPLYADDRLGYTPAINQAALLNDFVHTRSFARSMIEKTSLAPQLADPRTADEQVRRVQKAVLAVPSSNSFITIAVTMDDPDLVYATAQAVVSNFEDELRRQNEIQSSKTIDLYRQSVTSAEATLTKSQNELADYIAAHPEFSQKAPEETVSATQRDPMLGRLIAQVTHDQEAYTSLQQRYVDSQSSAAAGRVGLPFTFQVVDQPVPPLTALQRSRMSLLKLPAIGVVLALMLSCVIAVVLVLSNRAVQSAGDITVPLGIPVLGEIPVLRRSRRWWRRSPRNAVRLRMGGPAMTTAATTASR